MLATIRQQIVGGGGAQTIQFRMSIGVGQDFKYQPSLMATLSFSPVLSPYDSARSREKASRHPIH
jgi:hypothetical protein